MVQLSDKSVQAALDQQRAARLYSPGELFEQHNLQIGLAEKEQLSPTELTCIEMSGLLRIARTLSERERLVAEGLTVRQDELDNEKRLRQVHNTRTRTCVYDLCFRILG